MSKQHSYWIETNHHDLSNSVSNQIKKLLTKSKWVANKTNHDYLIIIGGDGTYVRFLRKYYEKRTKIVCINTGTVGFYSKFIGKNIKSFIPTITDDNNFTHPQLLEININDKFIFNAMNEVVIQSLNTVKMDVFINGSLYENYMGSGVLVTTRTGSTGQAKSNGGAIIFPNVDAFEFVELSPTNHTKHHSFNAPAILCSSAKIELNNFKSSQRCDLIIDGMRVRHINSEDKITITKQDAPFSLCFSGEVKSYISKLQQTFIKG